MDSHAGMRMHRSELRRRHSARADSWRYGL
jgi:hypothetical protein